MSVREANIQMYPSGTQTAPVDGVAVSSTNTYYSTPIAVHDAVGICIQVDWTGTPTGTLSIELSCDQVVPFDEPNRLNTASYTERAKWRAPASGGTFPANPAGSASGTIEQFGNMLNAWVRVKYVNASGSGTVSIKANSKAD